MSDLRKDNRLLYDDNLITNIFCSITSEIVNQSQWLLDEKFDELIDPMDVDKQNLIHVDNVLSVFIYSNNLLK